MEDLGLGNDTAFFQIGSRAFVVDTSANQVGYFADSIAAVTGVGGYVWLNSSKTQKAIGWDLYVNDEPDSYTTGKIVEFAGATYTVGPIQKPTLDVKSAKFFNVTDISSTPLAGTTSANTTRGTVFNISINLL